ncbi:MAG TPA: zinc finger Ran-binding domain-containing protein [Bacillota bacterium]|nr:zinc finger Ran-binding domain-containing protein [Bacillota bacterium]
MENFSEKSGLFSTGVDESCGDITCPHCGYINPGEKNNCEMCGESVRISPEEKQRMENESERFRSMRYQQPRIVSTSTKIPIPVIAVGCSLLLVFFGTGFFSPYVSLG